MKHMKGAAAPHGMLSSGAGFVLKRLTFVPARHPDAHSSNPADLGLIPLNDPVEVRRLEHPCAPPAARSVAPAR